MAKIKVDTDVMESAWRFAGAVRPLFDCVGIYLFGSHAKGTPRNGSDIDLAVVVPHLDGIEENPYILFDTEMRLWEIAHDIDNRIEPHFIDNSLDCAGFINTVLDTGIRLSKTGEAFFPGEDPAR